MRSVLTQQVRSAKANVVMDIKTLHAENSGQLPDLGSRKRRAAPSFLDPHRGRAGHGPALGALIS